MIQLISSICTALIVGISLTACGVLSSSDNAIDATDDFKSVSVFGLSVKATDAVDDAYLLHTATILAEYLDSDEDGAPDNPDVINKIKSQNAFMMVFKNDADLEANIRAIDDANPNFQDVRQDEILLAADRPLTEFDATLEEVLHYVTHFGFAKQYPSVFGEKVGSEIANAMDTARGGQFLTVPSTYPEGAWYKYTDTSCDYGCQVSEYTYWALTSILGGQSFNISEDYTRLDEIAHEWTLNTAEKVQATDTTVYALLTNATYNLPSTLPDGVYSGDTLSIQ